MPFTKKFLHPQLNGQIKSRLVQFILLKIETIDVNPHELF